MPAWLLPAISLGLQAGSQIFNADQTKKNNKAERQWNEKMYGLQRQHALEDWAMQNEYNHPSSQMARLREANLNPNMVYGNGTTTIAGPTRSSQPGSWNPKAPQLNIDPTNALTSYYDAQIKQAQVDNFRVQNTVLTQEAILKAAQTANTTASTAKTGVDTEASKFNLQLAQDLKATTLEAAKANLKKVETDTIVALDENERRAAMQAPSLAKAAEEILNLRVQRAVNDTQRDHLREQIQNLRKDGTLKQLDIQLKRLGIQPTDALWQRALGRLLNADLGAGDILPKILGNEPVPESLKKYRGVAPFGIPRYKR